MVECAGSHLVGSPRKRWVDTMKKCLRKGSLDIGQARRKIQDGSVWWVFVRGNAWGIAWGMNP